MPITQQSWLIRLATVCCLFWTSIAANAQTPAGPLVSAAWLMEHRSKVVLLDASVTPQHMAGHIPGAVNADLYRYGPHFPSPQAMEQRIRSWGIDAGSTVVVYDQGADMMATRLFFDLYHFGLPAETLFILDGGLAKWRELAGPVTKDPTPKPAAGNFRISEIRQTARVQLAEFLVASGDPGKHVLVDALDPSYYYGERKFFDRAGHVPNAVLMPSSDFFNADKTFKSADEIQRMARYLGIRPEQQVLSHCGGGVAASVPWFALQFLAGHPRSRLYIESQREWLRDERRLPYWTYAAPQLQRDSSWLEGWNAAMLRFFDAARLNLVDVRPEPLYAQGHVPFALNISDQTFRKYLHDPAALADLLGRAGVNPAHEVVVMGESGLTPGTALAFLALEQIGHDKVSVMADSLDDWALRGFELTKAPTRVGQPTSMQEIAVAPAIYSARPRTAILTGAAPAGRGEFPQVFVASGKSGATNQAPPGKLVQLAYTALLDADGKPRPAAELYRLISKAGIPRFAELILFADDPAEAAVSYYIFRLMGWPDVKVWAKPRG